jgi:hypothetical protein
MLDFTMPASAGTNGCPEKPGAAHDKTDDSFRANINLAATIIAAR